MKHAILIACTAVVGAGLSSLALSVQAPADVPYPDGYRDWKHVKTAVIGPHSPAFARFGGIHHIYANPKALAGYASGRFEDGSVLVFDLLEAIETKSDIEEGERRVVDVMVKDAKRFADTGGWGFEEFKGNSRVDRTVGARARTECFACHATRKSSDFVFSRLRD